MYAITTERSRMDIDRIHRYLAEESYWATHIPRELVAKAIENSLCFAAHSGEELAGFARVVTDYATYGYIADVFVLPEHRGRGVATQIMQAIVDHEALQPLRRWGLVTRDAHALYRKFGFSTPGKPERYMERVRENPYR